MEYDKDDPREGIKNEIEILVALGLVTVVGMTDDGDWLYAVTEKARQMSKDDNHFFENIQNAIEYNDEDWEENE